MRDRDVRAAMRARLRNEHANEPDTKIVDEMNVWSGSARIDMAVINGELIGYEIKSDRDDLSRLSGQIDIYGRVFDRVRLVAGSRHTERALGTVPKWWGIIEARESDGVIMLRQLRKGRENPQRDPLILATLLRKQEILNILESLGIAAGWRGKGAKALRQRLVDALPLEMLAHRVRETLKHRENWLGQ